MLNLDLVFAYMKLKSALTSFILLVIILFSYPSLVSAETCCGSKDVDVGHGRDTKQCFDLGTLKCNNVQGFSLKNCDKTKDVTDYDIDGNSTNDLYNPDCFIPIKAPSTVKITDFGRLFSGAVSFLLLIAFILAFFYLILGGISWLTSGGDKANVETARNKIIAAIIGLIIVAATWAIFQLIGGAIGFNILGGFELPTLF